MADDLVDIVRACPPQQGDVGRARLEVDTVKWQGLAIKLDKLVGSRNG
jgi:hypothetical protein